MIAMQGTPSYAFLRLLSFLVISGVNSNKTLLLSRYYMPSPILGVLSFSPHSFVTQPCEVSATFHILYVRKLRLREGPSFAQGQNHVWPLSP